MTDPTQVENGHPTEGAPTPIAPAAAPAPAPAAAPVETPTGEPPAGHDQGFVAPPYADRHFRRRWLLAAVLGVTAAGFCVWAALLTTYTIGHRAVAAVAALLAMLAAAAIAHAVLLTYQKQARGGGAVTSNLDFRQRGLKAAFIGDDGRASTSKTGIVVWTAAVVTALIYLLLLSRTVPGQSLFLGALNQNWRPEYLVLLGLPAAAATAAVAAVKTSNHGEGPDRIAAGDVATAGRYTRQMVPDDIHGFPQGLAELITDDNGIIAWADLQYVAFNVITLVYFASQVLSTPKDGLPPIPAALLTLMGVSATTYAANKGIETRTTS